MCAYRTQRYYSSIIYNNDINKKQNKTYKTTEFVSFFFLKTPNNNSDSQNPAQFERKRIRKKLRRRSLTFFEFRKKFLNFLNSESS